MAEAQAKVVVAKEAGNIGTMIGRRSGRGTLLLGWNIDTTPSPDLCSAIRRKNHRSIRCRVAIFCGNLGNLLQN